MTMVPLRARMQRVLRNAVRARKLTVNPATADWIDVETPASREQTPISPPTARDSSRP